MVAGVEEGLCPGLAPPPPEIADSLDRNGYALLRAAIPDDWLDPLREAFEARAIPREEWPVPRDADWRFAHLDAHPLARRVGLLPALLGCAWHLLRQPFFLTQVEGRDPRANGGAQPLHRDDLRMEGEAQVIAALAFLDDYGPANGATRIVAASFGDEPGTCEDRAVVLEGRAGDVLVFDARLLHGGTRNRAGTRRRSLLINYWVQGLAAAHAETRALRGLGDEPPTIHVGPRPTGREQS